MISNKDIEQFENTLKCDLCGDKIPIKYYPSKPYGGVEILKCKMRCPSCTFLNGSKIFFKGMWIPEHVMKKIVGDMKEHLKRLEQGVWKSPVPMKWREIESKQ